MDIISNNFSCVDGVVTIMMTMEDYAYLKRVVKRGETQVKAADRWYQQKKRKEEEEGVVKRPRGRPRKITPPKVVSSVRPVVKRASPAEEDIVVCSKDI